MYKCDDFDNFDYIESSDQDEDIEDYLIYLTDFLTDEESEELEELKEDYFTCFKDFFEVLIENHYNELSAEDKIYILQMSIIVELMEKEDPAEINFLEKFADEGIEDYLLNLLTDEEMEELEQVPDEVKRLEIFFGILLKNHVLELSEEHEKQIRKMYAVLIMDDTQSGINELLDRLGK